MSVSMLHASRYPSGRSARHRWAAVAAALAVATLTGCDGGGGGGSGGGGGQVTAPTLYQLEIPYPAGGYWTPAVPISPFTVLPTQGRGVRLRFNAPDNSAFAVSLRDLAGSTVATLPLNSGTPAPPDDGYYQILSKYFQGGSALPYYYMYVRAPAALADPLNYDILVVHKSLRTDMTDSSPMVVPLRRADYTVTVTITGSGHVVSTPAGIQCRIGSNVCSYDFGPVPVQVKLAPNSDDPSTTHFLDWAGNCDPNVQTCVLTLFGNGPASATAKFAAQGSGGTVPACPAAPLIAGWRWIDVPTCDIHTTGNTLQCDSNGYFCCAPGGPNDTSARCGGARMIESQPDCSLHAPRGRLIQPGGCYEPSP